MSDQRERIAISDLPSRPRGLSGSELGRLFGGACSYQTCKTNSDCCFRVCYKRAGEEVGVCRQLG
jgi:hypothetical protein